jgi:phosphatidylinositol-3-phosphatase
MKRLISIALLASAACSSKGGSNNPQVDAPHGTADAPNGQHDAPIVVGGTLTVFTIVLENHDYAEIIGSTNAPYINSLIAANGPGVLATNYKDSGTHPSLPNYLYMISGDPQYIGGVDLGAKTFPFPVDKPNLGTQLETANIKWRSYQESMGTPCKLTDGASGTYAMKHDPFLYFKDQQNGANNLCANTNVDYSTFATDLATNTYRYMFITPNLTSDGHDPATDPALGLQHSDTWLSNEVPKILASDAYKAGGVLFITWDEAEGRGTDDKDQVPMIILSPKLKQPGARSATAYTHGSYLATVEDLLKLPRLATVTNTPAMLEFFKP